MNIEEQTTYPASMTGWLILNRRVSGVEKTGSEEGMASFNARGGMRDLYIHPVFRRRKGVIRMVEVAGITGGEDGCSWRMRPDRGSS